MVDEKMYANGQEAVKSPKGTTPKRRGTLLAIIEGICFVLEISQLKYEIQHSRSTSGTHPRR